MTRPGLLAVATLRRVLAAVVAIDFCAFPFLLGADRASELARGAELGPFSDLLSRTPTSVAVAAVGLVAIVRFALRPGRLGAGAVALLALILLNTTHAQLYGSPWRHLYYGGLVLAGWLAGLVAGRVRGTPTDESWARVGGLALLGAAYLNAGISKLVFGGLDWLSGAVIQAIIVSQDGLVGGDAISVYRHFIVETPAAVSLFSIATVAFELAGPLMLCGRRLRLLVVAGLLGMHLNILLLTHILYWQSMVLLVVFGLSPDPVEAVPPSAERRRPYALAIAAGLLALCALAGIVHQGRRYIDTQAQLAVASLPPTPVPPTPVTLQIGPFAVGQTLADGWRLDALTRSERGFIVTTSGAAGRVSFEITCAALPYASPFDLGAAHILYSSTLAPQTFTAVGQAVREQVRAAAGDQSPCDRIATW
jgi:hypothetical protein